nr:glycosyltransferase [Sphingomonas japonica]
MGPSVLTLVKNRAAHLAQLVEGLRRSSCVPGELIVVDMSDDPVTIASADFPVRIVRLDAAGLPLAQARNLAAREATGDHLIFLDVDCIPMRDCIGRLHDVLATDNALLCADVRYLGPHEARGDWDEAALLAAGRPHPVRDFPATGLRHEPNAGLFWSLAFAIRRSTFASIGGFDEGFTGYGGEDTDFGYRAVARGVPLLFVGGATACHQWHESEDPPLRHLDDIVRNARYFQAIHGWWPMEGWLAAFERMGLIERSEHSIERRKA